MKFFPFEEVSKIITRSAKSVEFKVQNVSSFDPRPRRDKPISTVPNAQKILGNVFKWYWDDRLRARELYGTYVQQEQFNFISFEINLLCPPTKLTSKSRPCIDY